MNEIIEGLTLVIVGSWNPKIFNPQWISRSGLTNEKEINVEIVFNNSDLLVRFGFDNIFLTVSDKSLIINFTSSEDQQMESVADLVGKILTALPHTPLKAIGMNFLYHENDFDEKFTQIFKFYDNDTISDDKYEIQKSELTRVLRKDDIDINFTIVYDLADEKMVFNFNFHKDTDSAEDAKSFIKGKMARYRDESKKIVSFYRKKEV